MSQAGLHPPVLQIPHQIPAGDHQEVWSEPFIEGTHSHLLAICNLVRQILSIAALQMVLNAHSRLKDSDTITF